MLSAGDGGGGDDDDGAILEIVSNCVRPRFDLGAVNEILGRFSYHRLEWAFLLSPPGIRPQQQTQMSARKLRGKVDAMGVFAVSGGSATFERSRMFDTHRQLARIDR